MNDAALIERPAFTGKNITPFDEACTDAEDLALEARNWADGTPIPDAETAAAVTKLYDDIAAQITKLDDLRTDEVAPLNTQKNAIQARYHPFIGDTKAGRGKLVIAKEALNTLLAKWREAERVRREAVAAQAAREAEETKRAAEEAIRASAGNMEARESAELLLNDAKIAQSDAKRTAKAATTGLGLRTYYRAELTDLNAAIRHYWPTHKPEFERLVRDIAEREAGAGVTIPGFTITEEKRAL